ncbi:unnamed protein product [Triticum turgidum subsp. durum]|uniref:Peptidase M16 C-terminal domain-containing protein n=1 Tax=Triticum turgidum subsp. durum TaxID=4567 RepID=A0A9R1NPM4_TRITD|nr:unnamed protein product [Triticum turgidum subsp. durum]
MQLFPMTTVLDIWFYIRFDLRFTLLRAWRYVQPEMLKLISCIIFIELQKHLCSNNHPYHKFSTGNWDTLEVKPKEKGLDTRAELINFYDSHYSANLMQLAVYGKESLDNIQTLVESKFCDIKNVGRKHFSFPGHPCSSKDLQILVKAVPIKQGHTLRILWPITPNVRHYKEGPCRYVSHLIGHEGEGSLFYILKKLGWAMSLEAGEGDWSYDFSFFSVVIQLTDVGHEASSHLRDGIPLSRQEPS